MVSKQSCLSEEELWTLADAQCNCYSVEADAHVLFCKKCRHRLKRLQSSLDDIHRYSVTHSVPTTESNRSAGNSKSSRLNSEINDYVNHESPLPNGTLVSKYRICKCLSSGGQACIYLAEDLQLNRQVAIKLAHFSIDENIVAAEMILSEGELLAKVNHPRLAQVYDSGLHAGHPFLVTEYVQGCTLKDYIQSQTLSVRSIRLIILDVTKAVEAIHAHHILHLDLKPENVMIASNGHCKLIDLGTAWSMARVAENTETVVGGTIAYMAPEQYSGDINRYSERTDVFGLGAILFALLLGKPPVTQTPATANSATRLWEEARTELQDSNVDKELKKIGLKAMNVTPESRHFSATAFRKSIEATADRRMAFSVISMGVVMFLSGMFSICVDDQWDELFRKSDQVRPELVKTNTESSTEYGRRFVKIVARNSSSGPVQFCMWSQQTGAQFFSAIQTSNEQGEFFHELKTSHEGLDLTQIKTSFAFLAFQLNDPKKLDISKAQQIIERKLSRLCAKNNVSKDSGFIKILPDHYKNSDSADCLHLQLSAGLQSFCGVLISDETEQANCVQYEIELFMDEQKSSVGRNKPG